MTNKWFCIAALTCAATGLNADTLSFSTFVSAPTIAATESGNNSTIAFQFAGNKFVGSVYYGPDNNQLYSTNLTGGGLQQFGQPIPGASGEVVMGASLGQAGFATGDIYTGSGSNGQIYHIANAGGSTTLFTTLPNGSGVVRQIFFDPGSTFGGNMLVSTTSGQIFKVDHNGVATLIANLGADTEGMDIVGSSWGAYAGQLLVASEGSGRVYLVDPTKPVGSNLTFVANVGGAETVSVIPTTLNGSDPLQGFYVANYPFNIQFASAQQFISQGLLGDAIVTQEGSTAFDLHYTGSGFALTPFTMTGNGVNQFEDGIFVTPQRIQDTSSVPEPSSVLMLASAVLGLAGLLRRKLA